MKLIELLQTPWALPQANLDEIWSIYATHLRGDKIDLAAVEARIGRPLANEPKPYQVQQGVAIIQIDGVMAPKANLFMQVSGGASTQMIQRDLQAAVADPKVTAIILAIDSPGGSVIGTPELASAVAQATTVKPVVAFSDGNLMSAAYWVGSAASAVYISGSTVMAGSIGVVATHQDVSRANEARGVKVTEITAGKYKRIASQNEPLSTEGRASMQAQVDYLYTLFVDAVASHRGTTAEDVLQRMADGRVHIGQQAIDAGLVDGVSTLDALIAHLSTGQLPARPGASKPAAKPRAGVAQSHPTQTVKGSTMDPQANPPAAAITRESLERDHAGLFAQLRTEFSATAAAAERTRIQGVLAVAMPGHQALVQSLAFDGQTTPAQAALRVVAAENASRAAAIAAHAADAPAAVPASAPPPDASTPNPQEQVKQAHAHAKQHGVDFVAACKALGFRA
jgi:signal peptide peptidase SppA